MSRSWWLPGTGRIEHDFSPHHFVPEMIAGTRGMDTVFSKEDLWFFLERISRIGSEKIDEFDMLFVSSSAEDIPLSERAASEIAPEPSWEQRS